MARVHDVDKMAIRIIAVPAKKLDCVRCCFYEKDNIECEANTFMKRIGLPDCESGYSYRKKEVNKRK